MTVNMAKQPIVVAIVRYVDLHSLTAGLTDAGMVRVSMSRIRHGETLRRSRTILLSLMVDGYNARCWARG